MADSGGDVGVGRKGEHHAISSSRREGRGFKDGELGF